MSDSRNRETQNRRKVQQFKRVALPDEVGGGFVTIRCDPDTDEAELRRKALAKVKATRMAQAYSAMPSMKPNLIIQDSRVNSVMPKRRDPRIEKRIRSLTAETKVKKDKNIKMTFYPGPIGIVGKGNYVTDVEPVSQAASLGVGEGWRVLAVNGIPLPSNKDVSIVAAIEAANKKSPFPNGNVQITFTPGAMRIGTEVVLHGLKTHYTFNGAEGIIIAYKGDEKYDVSLTTTKLKTVIRGIHGVYIQLKHQEQYWKVVCPRGSRIKSSQQKRSDILGTLTYGTVLVGLHLGNWVKHDKGFSRIANPRTGKLYLQQDNYCRYGILWPLNLIRKELYFQICKVYEERRVDFDSIVRAAAVRRKQLEEQDRKKKSPYSHKQWKKFWKRQNPQFAAYYRRLYSENKKKMASGTNKSEHKERHSVRESDILSFPASRPEKKVNIYEAPFEEDFFEEDESKEANPFAEAEIEGMAVNQGNSENPKQANEEEDLFDFMSM